MARTALITTSVLALAGGAAVILTSGPDAPRAPDAHAMARVVEPVAQAAGDMSAIAADAPVYTLGDNQHSDWRRGQQTRFVIGDTDSLPALTIDASAIEPGRYTYDGDLTIEGTITQDYVEFTAGSITVTGGVTADHVTLNGLEAAPVNYDIRFGDVRRDDYYIERWKRAYPRGDVSIAGDVTGDQIAISGGTISIGGDADGAITLSASKGEIGEVLLRTEYRDTYRDTMAVREDTIPAEHTREFVRFAAAPWSEAITVVGTTGPDVVQQTTRDLTRQQEADAALASRRTAMPNPAQGRP